MQAKILSFFSRPYDDGMKTGRPAKYPRTPFGERIHAAREALGLSQAQVAEKLGITQMAYAFWERRPVALRSDQIEKLAEVLKVTPDYLFGRNGQKTRQSGPVGKMRQLFESASRLPRSQQQKVLDVLQPFVREHVNQEANV
jgi:transcriptional regulator with XRE-family HTH domain